MNDSLSVPKSSFSRKSDFIVGAESVNTRGVISVIAGCVSRQDTIKSKYLGITPQQPIGGN